METLQAIKTRRSVRKFTEELVKDEELDILMHAAMAAPSAMDHRPWEFYVIKGEETKQKVRDSMMFGKYKSPVIIIVCLNETKALPLVAHDTSYSDLSAAIENILLAAVDLGLGAVWCAIYPNKSSIKAVKKAIGAKLNHSPYAAIFLGHPSPEDKGKIKEKYDESNVHIIEK